MVDRYTKAVLTLIAISLVVIAVRGFDNAANAQQAHVYIDGASSYAFQYAGPMHVVCQEGCK